MTDLASRLANLSPTKRALLEKRLKQKQAQTAAIGADCVHQQFEVQAQQTPQAIAVEHSGQSLTYQQLNGRANQLAHYLRTLGVGPETLVGLHVERSLAMVVGLLGILKAGAAYVPLDPNYPAERLAFMVADAKMTVLVTQQSLAASLAVQGTAVVCLDGDAAAIAQMSSAQIDSGVKPENLAYVIYTSGSTGHPKGVMVEHRALASFVTQAVAGYKIGPRERVLQFASISFDAAAEEIYPCLVAGGTLVLRTDEMLGSVSQFLQDCQDRGLTVLDLPTAYWHQLVTELAAAKLALPQTLRLVIIGGEPALSEPVSLWQQLESRPQLVNTYGPTEATIVATWFALPESGADAASWQKLPIGRALPHVQVYILDQYQQLVPVGIPGELYLGGAGLARGY
ncbi:amino acid adenylation domain-containing protein, partial [Sphaerothrix gracilis]|uniref:amino acid adenylation domain-containing protein n=1 Tax=Sphaerothrix gracilis TaxID=3151835 RepID=UPI0031FCA3CB